jgi:uncharacterized SAM-dependent methyltransferase
MVLNYGHLPQEQNYTHSNPFIQDVFDLLDKKRQGHMEKWEYASPRYKNDPASGALAWSKLIANPGSYYPPKGDIETISMALQSGDLASTLKEIQCVVELGPGCQTSLSRKTLPIVNAAKNAKAYIAIDGTDDVANGAASFVKSEVNINGYGQSMDFFTQPLRKTWLGKSLMLFWGSTLGNFDGHAGDDPFKKLVGFLHNIKVGMERGDSILFSFDSEDNEANVVRAYSEPLMSAQILSIVHRMSDYCNDGNFDPYAWKHVPMWIEETMQLAHVIYPIIDQEFSIADRPFKIKAYDPIVSNNSYKYTPQKMEAAALMAGFNNPRIIKKDAMALLSAEC